MGDARAVDLFWLRAKITWHLQSRWSRGPVLRGGSFVHVPATRYI